MISIFPTKFSLSLHQHIFVAFDDVDFRIFHLYQFKFKQWPNTIINQLISIYLAYSTYLFNYSTLIDTKQTNMAINLQ